VLLQEAHNIKHFPKQYKLFPPRHTYSNLPINKKPRASILIHKSLVLSIIHVHDSRDLAIAQFQFQNNICYTASVYLAQHEDPTDTLKKIPANILSSTLILGSDLNSKTPLWGSSTLTQREIDIQNFIGEHNLTILNQTPHPPTFNRRFSSHIDATFGSQTMINKLINWEHLPQEWFQSGHRAIQLTFSFDKGTEQEEKEHVYFDYKAMNKEAFKQCIHNLTSKLPKQN